MIAPACGLLAAMSVQAASLSVAVDAALTNGTGWTYSRGFAYSAESRAYYFRSAEGAVLSPPLDFAVTGVVATAHRKSAATKRTLKIAAWRADAPVAASCVTFEPPDSPTPCAVAWPAGAQYDRVTLYNGAGDGSLYLLAITLGGVPFVSPPEGLSASRVRGETAAFAWTDDPRAVRSVVTVRQVVATPERWSAERHYDFEDCEAEHKVIPRSEYLASHYPEFDGSAFGVMTKGQLQLGTSDTRGWLSYAGRSDYAGVGMRLRVRRGGPNDKPTLSVTARTEDGEERLLALLDIGDAFEDRTVSLAAAPRGSRICLNTQCATQGDQRVVIDDIWFYDGYAPASTATNVVAGAASTCGTAKVTGLTPVTDYVADVVSYDAQGHASARAECAFRTSDGGKGAALWLK